MTKVTNSITNFISRYSLHKYFQNEVIRDSNKLGRWGNKTLKQTEIAEYWTNIDHCGDSLCGNLQKTKKFYEKEILKIKN
tara:strand:- start:2365 stop:2604 length:240 start_codon:yes stop_codon:yes gene_type:complete